METDHLFCILLVDDKPHVLAALARIFRMNDFDILTAGSGREALDVLRTTEKLVMLIIADQHMPGMSGVEFLEKSREIFPYAIRFLFTAHTDMEALITAVNKGGIHQYISKPWDDKDVLYRVRKALEERESFLKNAGLHGHTLKERREYMKFNQCLEKSLSMPDESFRLQLDE